jgi:hypothetical protein
MGPRRRRPERRPRFMPLMNVIWEEAQEVEEGDERAYA